MLRFLLLSTYVSIEVLHLYFIQRVQDGLHHFVFPLILSLQQPWADFGCESLDDWPKETQEISKVIRDMKPGLPNLLNKLNVISQ